MQAGVNGTGKKLWKKLLHCLAVRLYSHEVLSDIVPWYSPSLQEEDV